MVYPVHVLIWHASIVDSGPRKLQKPGGPVRQGNLFRSLLFIYAALY